MAPASLLVHLLKQFSKSGCAPCSLLAHGPCKFAGASA